MREFKIGDKVRILAVDRSISPSMEVTDKGTITDINTVSPSAVRVKCDTWKNDFNNGSWFHVRQLRKLLKIKKAEPVEKVARIAWLPTENDLYPKPTTLMWCLELPADVLQKDYIQFRECLPGELVITRESVDKAMNDAVHGNGCFACEGSQAEGISRLAKAMGFES